MIIDALIKFVQGLIDSLFSLMPEWSMPAVDTSSNFIAYALVMNRIFPVKTALLVLLAVIAIRVAFNIWDLAVFVYHQFWGGN